MTYSGMFQSKYQKSHKHELISDILTGIGNIKDVFKHASDDFI